MTQKDKKLLLKDLCARLPYEPKVQYKEKTYDLLGLDKGRIFVNIVRIGEWLPTVYTFDIKPYLRPLSSMTEEEKEEFYKTGNVILDCDSYSSPVVDAFEMTFESFDWLNRHHFDYRGLIPMGLALEAPEDMYN